MAAPLTGPRRALGSTEDRAPAAQIIDALLGEGEHVDDGAFTLDPAAAAAKLAAFQYADRSVYLIVFAEALFGLGAAAIELDSRASTLRITATGVELPEPSTALRELYSYALGGSRDPRAYALGRLAVALDVVLGSGADVRAELRYAGASGSFASEFRWQRAPSVSPSPGPAQSSAPGQLHITVHGDRSRHAEASCQLRDAARCSDRELYIDGERISRMPRPWLEVWTGEGPGYRFRAGLEPREGGSVVELWSAGVCIDRLPSRGRGFRAALELDAPRRDLSRMKVVRDPELERALTAIEGVHEQARAQLARLDQLWTREGWPPEWPPERVDRILERPVRAHFEGRARAVEAQGMLALMRRHLEHTTRQIGRSESFISGFAALFSVGCLVVLFLGAPFTAALVGSIPLLGLLALIAHLMLAPWAAHQAIQIRDRGIQTRARVTGTDRDFRNGAKIEVVCVEWEFTDHDGAKHTGTSLLRELQEANKWPAGTQISVYYDPSDPSRSVWEADVGPRRG